MTTSQARQPRIKTQGITWTLNNYTQDDKDAIKDYIKAEADFGCFSEEKGQNGTPHLQGYHHYSSQRSYPCKAFEATCNNRFHCEVAKGSPRQNRDYCLGMVEKKGNTPNTTYWEHGELPLQGRRTDWLQAKETLKTGSVAAVIEEQPHLLPCIRALKEFRAISQTSTHRNINVIVIVGETGTGKSRSAWDAYPDLYSKPTGQWWDGYDGQKVVLLDDYNGEHEITTLLKWLDRYPVSLPVKGGFVAATYETVVITSNRTPDEWYKFEDTKHLAALKRRITTYLSGKSIYTQADLTNHNQHANQENDL